MSKKNDELTLSRASKVRRTGQTRSSQGAEIIKQRIKQGLYKPGDHLPSIRVLSDELNLSVPSVYRAMRQLERESILESEPGVGNRILDTADCSATPLFFGFVQPYFSLFSLALQHYLESAMDSRANFCVMKSAGNDPERERHEIERLLASGVSGILLWPVGDHSNSAFLQEVAQKHPLVLVDRTVEGVQAPAVVLDHEGGARQIIRRLVKLKKTRILVVCDPIDISSFRKLKNGMREEAKALGIESTLDIVDYPVSDMIEGFYDGDYDLIDECYAQLAPILASGKYDALICPQDEWFDQVFAECGRTEVLEGIKLVTLRTVQRTSRSRRYNELGVEEWVLDTAAMITRSINILQDMTLSQRVAKRTIKIPITVFNQGVKKPKRQPDLLRRS